MRPPVGTLSNRRMSGHGQYMPGAVPGNGRIMYHQRTPGVNADPAPRPRSSAEGREGRSAATIRGGAGTPVPATGTPGVAQRRPTLERLDRVRRAPEAARSSWNGPAPQRG